MKVLAIMGSPRKKGNTYQVTRKVEKEMKRLGNVEFEYVFLKDASLEPCKGCFACIKKGDQFCPLKDDRPKIEEKITNADGVILASPVYVIQVSGIMKLLIDRMAYVCHRPRFFKQKALVIATTGGLGLKETLNYLELVARGWGLNLVGKLGIQTPPWPLPPKSHAKNDKKIQEAARTFYKALKTDKLPSPSLSEYLRFKITKGISERLKEYLQADYQFYHDQENYYYETKVGIFKKLISSFMLKIGLFMMRDNFVEHNETKRQYFGKTPRVMLKNESKR